MDAWLASRPRSARQPTRAPGWRRSRGDRERRGSARSAKPSSWASLGRMYPPSRSRLRVAAGLPALSGADPAEVVRMDACFVVLCSCPARSGAARARRHGRGHRGTGARRPRRRSGRTEAEVTVVTPLMASDGARHTSGSRAGSRSSTSRSADPTGSRFTPSASSRSTAGRRVSLPGTAAAAGFHLAPRDHGASDAHGPRRGRSLDQCLAAPDRPRSSRSPPSRDFRSASAICSTWPGSRPW